MNGGAPPFAPMPAMPAAPAGAAPAQPQGLWGGVPPQQGFMSNPMVMAGIMGLAEAASGRPSGPGMARGFGMGQQMQDSAWSRQMQGLQMQKLLRDEARTAKQEQALAELVKDPKFRARLGTNADVWAALPMEGKVDVAKSLFENPEYTYVAELGGFVDKYGNMKDSKGVSPGLSAPGVNNPATGWSVEGLRREYDMSKYTPASVEAALSAQDPSLLIDKTGTEALDPKEQLSYAKFVEDKLAVFDDIQNSIDQINALLPGEGGPEQLAALIQYAKALDPGSVVREGEVALQRQSAGLIATIETMIDRATKEQGGILSEGQKESIASATRKLQKLNAQRYQMRREWAQDLYGEMGVSPELMPPALTAFTQPIEPGAFIGGGGAAGGAPVPAGPAPTQPEWPEWARTGPATRALEKYGIDPTQPGAREALIRRMQANNPGMGPGQPPPLAPGMGGPGGIWAR